MLIEIFENKNIIYTTFLYYIVCLQCVGYVNIIIDYSYDVSFYGGKAWRLFLTYLLDVFHGES